MENPRKRLFPYHLNADKIEKEYRIWKCLEEELKQEKEKKLKINQQFEEKRMEFWDSIKKNNLLKKNNPFKKKDKTKNKPKWEEIRNKQNKSALNNASKRNSLLHKQNLKWEQNQNLNNKNSLKNSQIRAQKEINWEKRREKNRNNNIERTIQQNIIRRKKPAELEQKRKVIRKPNIIWNETRKKQHQHTLEYQTEKRKSEKKT